MHRLGRGRIFQLRGSRYIPLGKRREGSEKDMGLRFGAQGWSSSSSSIASVLVVAQDVLLENRSLEEGLHLKNNPGDDDVIVLVVLSLQARFGSWILFF